MPDADDAPRGYQDGDGPTEAGRRRGRVLVPGVVVGLIVGIFLVLLLVTQCASGGDPVENALALGAAVA